MLGGLALKWRWRERMRQAGQADRPAQPGDGRQRPGLLGEVLPLLGRRAAAGADGGRPLPPRRRRRPSRCATRTRSASSRSSARRSTAATSRSRRSRPRSTSSSASGDSTCPIHVDGASGGFVAPFLQPELEWDFRIPRVQSINASGHKYGLVYPGRRLGDLARRGRAAARPGVRRQLPRRPHADVRAELLAPRQRGDRPVLHVHDARARRLPPGDAGGRRTWPPTSPSEIAKHGSLPADLRGQGASGVRVRAEPRRQELHRVRRFRPAAPARLAGAGLQRSRRTART